MWLWTPLSPTNSTAFKSRRFDNNGYNTHRPEYAVNFIILFVFSERYAERKRKRRAESIVILQPRSRDCVVEITGWFVPLLPSLYSLARHIIAQFIQPGQTHYSRCCDLCIAHTGTKEFLTNTVIYFTKTFTSTHLFVSHTYICFTTKTLILLSNSYNKAN